MPAPDPTPFKGGAEHERFMGRWSRLAGNVFLERLAPRARISWLGLNRLYGVTRA